MMKSGTLITENDLINLNVSYESEKARNVISDELNKRDIKHEWNYKHLRVAVKDSKKVAKLLKRK